MWSPYLRQQLAALARGRGRGRSIGWTGFIKLQSHGYFRLNLHLTAITSTTHHPKRLTTWRRVCEFQKRAGLSPPKPHRYDEIPARARAVTIFDTQHRHPDIDCLSLIAGWDRHFTEPRAGLWGVGQIGRWLRGGCGNGDGGTEGEVQAG